MKVKCIGTTLTDEQRTSLGISFAGRPKYGDITPGLTYTVLAISVPFKSVYFGSCALFDIMNNHDSLSMVPMCLFEIVDGRVSKYLEARKFEEFGLNIWPSEFFAEYFHDRLSDGDPDAHRILRSVRKKMEEEFS
jgi:hypothetical protein